MFNIEDRAMAVREVQKYLLVISQTEEYPVAVIVDGVYGDNTRAAVSVFQRRNGIAPTGAVDIITFYALEEQYSKIIEATVASEAVIDRSLYPLQIGDSSEDVSILNSYIRALNISYPDLPFPESGSFFSKKTEDAVKNLQSRMLRDENGEVDRILMVRIYDEIRFRNIINNSDVPV